MLFRNDPTRNESNLINTDPKLIALDKNDHEVANHTAPENRAKVYIYKLDTGSSALDAGLPVDTDVVTGFGIKVPDKD